MSQDIRNMIDKLKSFRQSINENLKTVYRCIDGDYKNSHNKVEYFSVNFDYSQHFGENCYKITLDTSKYKILDLEKWNKLFTKKTGKNGNLFNKLQGLFVIGEMAINSNYEEELKVFSKSFSQEIVNEFLNEFNNCDAIYGEDAGYVDEFVFAVKNKNMIINVETIT